MTLFFVVINYVSEYQKNHFSLFIRCSDIILSKLVWGRISGDPSLLKRRCHEIFDNLFLLKKFRVFYLKRCRKSRDTVALSQSLGVQYYKYHMCVEKFCFRSGPIWLYCVWACNNRKICKYQSFSAPVPYCCRVFKENSTRYYFCSTWMLI